MHAHLNLSRLLTEQLADCSLSQVQRLWYWICMAMNVSQPHLQLFHIPDVRVCTKRLAMQWWSLTRSKCPSETTSIYQLYIHFHGVEQPNCYCWGQKSSPIWSEAMCPMKSSAPWWAPGVALQDLVKGPGKAGAGSAFCGIFQVKGGTKFSMPNS